MEEKDIQTTPSFEDFNFDSALMQSLNVMNFKTPTPIQQQAIPIIQDGRDIIACAQTGTGKTAAFLLPIMDKIRKSPRTHINTLIVVPTRELAIQIDRQLEGFAYFLDLTSIPIYGGKNPGVWGDQQRAIENGTDILIGTPGRLIAHFDFKYAKTDTIENLILDEADRMLDMGFHEDILKIIKKLPNRKQTLMFSATMPPKIRTLAKEILNDPAEVSIAISKPAEGITQQAYMTYDEQKYKLLKRILKDRNDDCIIVFCASKKNTKEIAKNLKASNFPVEAMHSELEQAKREEVIQKFVAKRIKILIATDVLSRGIDIDDIGLVINYDVPRDAEDYIHRIGRTARAASKGEAITFINPKDQHSFYKIEQLMERTVEKLDLPEELGKAPKYEPKKRFSGGGGRGRSYSKTNKSKSGSRKGGNKNYRGKNKSNNKSRSNSSNPQSKANKPQNQQSQKQTSQNNNQGSKGKTNKPINKSNKPNTNKTHKPSNKPKRSPQNRKPKNGPNKTEQK